MNRIKLLVVIAVAVQMMMQACNNGSSSAQEPFDTAYARTTMPAPIRERVLTAEEQKALTPALIIQSLKDGNKRFVNNDLTLRDHSAMVRNAASGQFPKAVILSCVDSRVPVEDMFDKGIGDLFIARVAGNIVNDDILGSMEFGCKVSGAKLIVVMGHESCGAIKGAIDNVKLGNMTAMLDKIKPAVARSQNFQGDKTSKNEAFVDYVAINNVAVAIENIKARSPILMDMLKKGEIKIVGAYYSLKTGEVTFLEGGLQASYLQYINGSFL